MNQNRLDIKDIGLNLKYLNKDDSMGIFIEKINANFREISSNGGGPMGPPGVPGRPGCPGRPGPMGPSGDLEIEWLGRMTKPCTLSTDEEIYNIISSIGNKYTNRTVLLSNLYELTSGGISRLNHSSISEEKLQSFRESTLYSDYKIKIYNADENGIGKHIHLINTKAVIENNQYLCASGYTISNDWNINNIETLRIAAVENNNIPNLVQNVEYQTDTLILKRNEYSQELRFDPGVREKTTEHNNFRQTIQLVDLTDQRVVNIPDRSGFSAVWQDTLERSEIWEIIDNRFILINHGKYETENGDIFNINNADTHFVSIDNGSLIRFKRLNNFVLIDYHIGLINNQNQYNFYLHNIQLKVNRPTVGCITNGWNISSVVEDEAYISDEINNKLSLFKVDSSSVDGGTNNTFVLSYKLNVINKLFYTLTNNVYWLSGQIWATVQSPSCALISFDIEQIINCPELNITSLQ